MHLVHACACASASASVCLRAECLGFLGGLTTVQEARGALTYRAMRTRCLHSLSGTGNSHLWDTWEQDGPGADVKVCTRMQNNNNNKKKPSIRHLAAITNNLATFARRPVGDQRHVSCCRAAGRAGGGAPDGARWRLASCEPRRAHCRPNLPDHVAGHRRIH